MLLVYGFMVAEGQKIQGGRAFFVKVHGLLSGRKSSPHGWAFTE